MSSAWPEYCYTNRVGDSAMGFSIKLFGALVILISLSGCAKGSALNAETPGEAPAAQAPVAGKTLFSQWVESSGFVRLDLRQGQFGSARPIVVQTATGVTCNCQALFQGSEANGTIQISSCSGHAQCASFNDTGQYQLSSSKLTTCYMTSGCLSFQ